MSFEAKALSAVYVPRLSPPIPDSPPSEKATPPLSAFEDATNDESQARAIDRKLLSKLDRNLIPFLSLLYLLSFLDRINFGVAKLSGIIEELNLTSLQFNTASMVFFVTYVAFEVPSNLILKKMRPSRWIPLIVICWGIVQTTMGVANTYGQLVALRCLLGFFECGLFPGLSFYLSSWYPRKELGLRIALFFSAATLAGAFGGILGYGLSKMAGIGGLGGWAWIFIIEGLLTFVVGCIAPWFVHDFPTEKPRFLNEEERVLVLRRLFKETGIVNTTRFDWQQVRNSLMDYKTYFYMACHIGITEPIYSQALFSPTVIAALGKWSTSQSLLLTVPPYVLATVTTVGTALWADKIQQRGLFLMFWSALASVGYIILLTVPISSPGVLYFAIFLTVGSIAPGIACNIAWVGGNFGNHYKKATSFGLTFSMGNAGGIVASQIYRSRDSPRFLLGHGITLGFCVFCFFCSSGLHFLLKRENARRDRIYGPPPPPPMLGETYSDEILKKLGLSEMSEKEILALGDDHPTFRFVT
ncbi:transporter [Mrakia frigida]|uniref:transporter n=1 Tax=Mrakia frigida TaxID=29902 RepID=UPI003FCC2344